MIHLPDLKHFNPLIHGLNDQRILHFLDGDIEQSFEGIVDILFHYMKMLNPENFRGENVTDDLIDVFDVVKKIDERGYLVVGTRVTLSYLYFLARGGEQHCDSLRKCDQAAKKLMESGSFKNFLWFLLTASNENNDYQFKSFNFKAVFDLHLNPDVSEFIFKEFNNHYPGNTLLEDISPWDELDSGIHEAKSALFKLKEKIEEILEFYHIHVDNDPKAADINQRFENLKRDIDSSLEESAVFASSFKSYFGNEPNYFVLMSGMSGLYHTLHHSAERNFQ